ncbi:NUDIX domain-containing protein [Streptomyces sp. M600PL45_2]|uniref:NUDIX domain-containing protein n=2 Tax=Streptomyces marispadix TaxID=2922868 RepID=A0ABS9SUL0_9ACTN|nr:NUDIX domain-containing protein [Streptomyces marispadix]
MDLGTWYSLPGGRQCFGETMGEALVRECKEELGADVSAGPLLFVREYIHARHSLKGTGRDQHKIEFMFSCILNSRPAMTLAADKDQSTFEWVDLAALSEITIFPTGLGDLKGLLEKPNSVYWGDTF